MIAASPRLPQLDQDTNDALRKLLSNSYWRSKTDDELARRIGVDEKHVRLARTRRPSDLNRTTRRDGGR